MVQKSAGNGQALFDQLRGLVTAVNRSSTKTAAGNPPDPGSIGGATTHPVASLDNGCSPTSTGDRAAEYERDIKEDQGAIGVDSVSAIPSGSAQDSVTMTIGMTPAATGEAPAVEDDYKGGKDDPGTELDARTDNDQLDGKKYAAYSVNQLCDAASEVANILLADAVNGFFSAKTADDHDDKVVGGTAAEDSAATTDAAPTGEKQPKKPDTETTTGEGVFEEIGTKSAGYDKLLKSAIAAIAAQKGAISADGFPTESAAGYKQAAALGMTVKAAHKKVSELLEGTIQDALDDATLLGSYLMSTKQALEMASGEDHDDEDEDTSSGAGDGDSLGEGEPSDDESGGGGEAPSESCEDDGKGGGLGDLLGDAGGSGMDPAPPAGGGGGSLGDMLGGGGDPGGMMPPEAAPPMGGDPMGGAAMGGDPMGGAAMGGGPPGADMLGGAPPEEAINQLVAALQELGITPEELAAAGPPQGGAPGGAPGGMGGDPTGGMGGGDMSEGMKLASVAKAYMRTGRYRVKEAADKTAQRKLRDRFKGYIIELMTPRG